MGVLFWKDAGFAHCVNRDGSIDSICRQCFAKVARKTREVDLGAFERKHACYPSIIEMNRRIEPKEGKKRKQS
jgi:hypothetical protein